MKWVVLSDLHMDFKNCTTKTARKELLKVLKKENQEEDISFVLITGDCLHRNHGNVEKSRAFIQEIGKSCGVEKDRIIICPGNHDIDRENAIRNTAITNYREHGVLPEVEKCLDGYGNFRELYSLVYGERYKPFFYKDVDDFRIIEIDSCLLSKDDKDYGKLIVGFSELADLSDKIPKDEKINIVMMHHGVEWLQADDGRRFQHWLVQNNVKMVFCGHNHAPGMNILTEGISENRLPMEGIPQFTCGCALADSYSNPVFMVGKYMNDESLEIGLYEYRNNSRWEKASGLLRSFPDGSYQASTLNGMIRNSYDIPKIYNTIYDMGNDAEKEIKTSSRLDFFGLRGGTFLKGNSKIANALYEKEERIVCRLLVSDPYSPNIEKRLRSVPVFSPQLELEKQWKTNYQDIKKLRDNFPVIPSWSLRFHEQSV